MTRARKPGNKGIRFSFEEVSGSKQFRFNAGILFVNDFSTTALQI
jgi:hypothetical protein